jgi:hypothetical protein
MELGSRHPTFACVREVHYLKQLENDKSILNEEIQNLEDNLHILISDKTLLKQYEVFTRTIELISDLTLKWGIADYIQYSYRMLGQAIYMKLFDLEEINKRAFNMDILWCTIAYDEAPFDELFDEYTRQLGIILRTEIEKFLIFILRMNHESNFQEVPSINGCLLDQNPKLKSYLEASENSTPTKYARLEKPGVLYKFCTRRNSRSIQRNTFYEMLCDVELAYRYFEKSVMLRAMEFV